ncbi:MAG: hypothetical protein WC989_08800 [Micavibrio sp.]
MCKFHKDVARDIATDDSTGAFDAGRYATALVAMAMFRLEQYMPAMHSCDGFNPDQMLTGEAKLSFAQSGLERPQSAINNFRNFNIGTLRQAMDFTAQNFSLSLEALNIPDRITKAGYKATCCAEADPTENGPFLDEAVVELFEGYDDADKTWAANSLSLIPIAHKPEFEAIRMATEHFISQPGIHETLKAMFEHSVASIFQNAQAVKDAGLGRDSEGCVMCGHGSRAAGLSLS